MKKLPFLVLLVLTTTVLFAQKGDQMIGVSALQYARAGAIIASPVDAPSMIYNPAAIANLNITEIGFDHSLGIINPPREITTGVGTPYEKTTSSNSNTYLGMGNGFVYKVSDKIYLGMAAGGVSGLGVDFPATTLPDDPNTPFPENVSIVSKKGLLKLTPTFAYKVTPNFTLAVSVQIVDQSLTLKNPYFMLPPSESWGYGACVGLIYKALPNLQIGLSYTTEIDVPEHKFNGTSLVPQTGGEGVYRLEMNNPAIAALGIAYRPVPKLLIEGDFKWINLSNVMYEADLTCPSGYVIPITFGWDDVWVYALGIEYKLNNKLKIIGGWTYAATPIKPEYVENNIGSIAVVEHHFSLAANKRLTKHLSATFSYTYGLWNEVESNKSPLKIAAGFNMFFIEISYYL